MALPSGKVWCTCSMCSQRVHKHPRTNTLTNGNLIDRRKYDEHVVLDKVDTILSTGPSFNSRMLESQEEERERISEEILLANLQADFQSLNLSDRNIPTTMPVPRSTAPNMAIPQHIRQALETADVETAALLAEASELRSKITDYLQPPIEFGIELLHEGAFPGIDLAVRLWEMHNTLRELNVGGNEVANGLRLDMQRKVEEQLSELDDNELLWTMRFSRNDSTEDPSLAMYDTSDYFNHPMNSADPVLVIAVFSVLLVNIFSHVNRSACNLLLQMMQVMIRVAIQRCYPNGELPPFEKRVLKDFPRDVRTARRALDVEPKLILFASCPQCHYCHPLRPAVSGRASRYPATCYRIVLSDHGQSICGERLVQNQMAENASMILKPLRPFYFHDPKEFIASMVTRPGMERLLDNYWARVGRQGIFDMKDLGDGTIVKELLNADMIDGFAGMPKEVGRIVFAISVDWFNPYEMRIRGPTVTAGIIALVCLNLPGHIRYRPENVFPVSVLPGLDEPSLTDINHYFRPMVDSLLELWSPGVYFRRTHDYSQGRTYRAALLPLIADYPALRKALGVKISPHAKEHFCTYCDVPQHEIHKWLNADPSDYPRRTAAQHHAMAYEWRDAPTQKDQNDLFKRTGIRYTELLRLPYWDPTRFMVVDPMHNLFLGLIQTHYRVYLGIQVKDDKKSHSNVDETEQLASSSTMDAPVPRAGPQVDERKARQILSEFRTLQLEAWKKKMKTSLNRPTLDLICQKLCISIPQFSHRTAKKDDVIDSIGATMRANPDLYFHLDAPGTHGTSTIPPSIHRLNSNTPPSNRTAVSHSGLVRSEPSGGHQKRVPVLGPNEVKAIQQDIAKLVTPSWVTAIPRNFGEAKAGTLKSDQWRSALNLYLPLTMIRLWGNLPSTDRRKRILDNTMMLLQAIQYASDTTMTEAKAKMYTVCMKSYLNGLHDLFPHRALKPNHHMALHIKECLIRFGPIRGWWAFPFERLVGALQHVQTNWKFGELEHTMITSYMAGSNIRIMLASHRQPEALNECKDSIAQYLGKDELGTLTIETLHVDSDNVHDTFQLDAFGNISANVRWDKLRKLPTEIYSALRSYLSAGGPDISNLTPMAVLCSHFTKGGRKYSTSQATYRDSLVLYNIPQGRIIPGSILSVFSRIDGRKSDGSLIVGHYVAVQPFDEKAVNVQDSFKRYHAFGAYVCRNKLNGTIDIIRPQDIVSQFAQAPFDLNTQSDLMIVIPLRPA